MNPGDQKDIDRLFREGLDSESNHVAFVDDNWHILEQRLDAFEKRLGKVKWLKTLTSIAAVIVVTLSIWLLWTENQTLLPDEHLTENLESSKEELPKKQIPIAKKKIEDVKKESIEPHFYTSNENDLVQVDNAIKITTESRLPIPISTEDSLQVIIQGEIKEKDITSISGFEYPETTHLATTQLPIHEVLVIDPKEKYIEKNDPEKNNQFAISLLAAPAYNGIDNLNNGSMGGDFGILVTMNLTKKWSVSTGAIYAKKIYETGLDSYNSGYGSSNESVDADCRILDIPLNLNYAVWQKGNTIVSLGTGISSYMMLKEDYHLYNTDQYNSQSQDVHLVNENQHWFSVLNLQANIQQRLNTNLSISIQPYLKLPFNDIGYANVKLQSIGLALSANLNI
ncbi:hypothetical protein ACUNWD_14545 [Sunxiuqinia sp. A32]|uniref:hypothetical protein n=1 Tax=Sunxiuqinia sp. A32 TaxID=3461496 RepID=UPI004045D6BB